EKAHAQGPRTFADAATRGLHHRRRRLAHRRRLAARTLRADAEWPIRSQSASAGILVARLARRVRICVPVADRRAVECAYSGRLAQLKEALVRQPYIRGCRLARGERLPSLLSRQRRADLVGQRAALVRWPREPGAVFLPPSGARAFCFSSTRRHTI